MSEALRTSLDPWLTLAATSSQPLGSAVVGIVPDVMALLTTPKAYGELFRLALAVSTKEAPRKDLVLAALALIIYSRFGGLTSRQAWALARLFEGYRDADLEQALEEVALKADFKGLEPAPVAEPEVPSISPFTVAALSWATMHASLGGPLQTRLTAIAAKLGENQLGPGSFKVMDGGGETVALVRWGDFDPSERVIAEHTDAEGRKVQFAAQEAATESAGLRELIRPILVNLLAGFRGPNS